MQAAIGLEKIGLPPVAAGLAVLLVALVVLDTFNQSVLGEGTLNNPVNSLGFAAAGKGPFVSHVLRIVSCSCLDRIRAALYLCAVHNSDLSHLHSALYFHVIDIRVFTAELRVCLSSSEVLVLCLAACSGWWRCCWGWGSAVCPTKHLAEVSRPQSSFWIASLFY